MSCYQKGVIEECALYRHVKVETCSGRFIEGWLVPNPNDGHFMNSKYVLLEDGGGATSLERSHIRWIWHSFNGCRLPKKKDYHDF